MDKTAKLAALWEMLTKRYGEFLLKPGQKESAIKQSWVYSLGAYSHSDLTMAARRFITSSKYERWPNDAELLEILRSFFAEPEGKREGDEMPVEWKQALANAVTWFEGVRAREGWKRAGEILSWWHGETSGLRVKNYKELMVAAWNRQLPDQWPAVVAAYDAAMADGIARYRRVADTMGVARANSMTPEETRAATHA